MDSLRMLSITKAWYTMVDLWPFDYYKCLGSWLRSIKLAINEDNWLECIGY